ncbi:MAG: aldehyde dehydrogenase family protein, partial [Stackebrandtia sp.]
RVLRAAADALRDAGERIAWAITAEEGKTIGEARGEVDRAAATLHYQAGRILQPEGATYAAGVSGAEVRTVREPLGAVAVITPWNFPTATPLWKIAPALAHGNAVVWKPAEQTPTAAVATVEALTAGGLPPGVLNLLVGDARTGAALVDHPGVAAISFTGSTSTGQRVIAAAAPRRVPVQAEMGGHNPAIVFDDADLDSAADHLVAGAMLSTGQKCTATRRIAVARSVYDAVVERLVRRIEALIVGDGAEAGVDLGPLVSAEALADVMSAVDEAREAGFAVLAGGRRLDDDRLDGGHYVAPTLLAATPGLAASPESPRAPRVWAEEVFGPVAVIAAVEDDDHAFAVANATSYGLSAAVHTSSLARTRQAISRLNAGMICVNGPTTGAELHAPFGGVGRSSAPGPREQGDAAREFYTRTKTVTVHDPGT